MNILLLALGGALGAISRFEVVNLFEKKHPFPFSTLTVNLIGSALLGIVMAWFVETQYIYTFFAVGFLGAFTTFSTFSVESMKLIQEQQWLTFILYLTTTILGAILAFTLTFFLF
ncbi:fluoride efflux transporter CrcB [Aquisalibacillus elongatus]|uniref:Fluoride-specific ion channel FluC n=1 Tax=Aquisalibacillus elongatus TaxID=485577 RepID=A0A3N5BT56_9BACI|nr:fluoride efflux transporter CrcB [Aquisalibacillus elongatus]RPF50682.1 camphor resistance protein CrcB [Aquisalibacillus elongatus]